MAIVTKTSKDGRRKYQYEQTSVRVGGKVKTKSVYIGPLHPKRQSFRSKVRNILNQMGPGVAELAIHTVRGTLPKTPKWKDDSKPYDRAARVLDDKLRALGQKWAVPDKQLSPDGRKTGHFASQPALDSYKAEHGKLVAEYLATKPAAKAEKTAPATADKAPAVEAQPTQPPETSPASEDGAEPSEP